MLLWRGLTALSIGAIFFAGRDIGKTIGFPIIKAKWKDWHLFYEGKEYYSPYEDEKAWTEHWNLPSEV